MNPFQGPPNANGASNPPPPPVPQTDFDKQLNRPFGQAIQQATRTPIPLPPVVGNSPLAAPPAPQALPAIPPGFASPPPPRNIAVEQPDISFSRKAFKSPPLPFTASLLTNVALDTLIGTAVTYLKPGGIQPPPNILVKAKAIAELAKARPGTVLKTVADTARTPGGSAFLSHGVAGVLAGQILGAGVLNAAEEQAIANREAVEAAALADAVGQRAPLTHVEVDAVRAALGDDNLTRVFVNEFNAVAAQNAKVAAAQDAVALAGLVKAGGLAFIGEAQNPAAGFVTLVPTWKADP